MVITKKRKMMFSRMLEPLQACEKIYNATAFSTVPNYTNLVLSNGLFTGREKIKISVSNRPAENAIISVEHGIGDQLSPKKFLKMCTVQLKKIADAQEGAEIAPLVIRKNAGLIIVDELNFSRRCEILKNNLETGKINWSAGGVVIKTRDQDVPF